MFRIGCFGGAYYDISKYSDPYGTLLEPQGPLFWGPLKDKVKAETT